MRVGIDWIQVRGLLDAMGTLVSLLDDQRGHVGVLLVPATYTGGWTAHSSSCSAVVDVSRSGRRDGSEAQTRTELGDQ